MRLVESFAYRVRTAHGDACQAQGRMRMGRGGGARELRGIRLSASGIAHPQWNNGDVTAADADIEGARVFFAANGVPGVCAFRRACHGRTGGFCFASG